jgi:electron transport complex protein RnfB
MKQDSGRAAEGSIMTMDNEENYRNLQRHLDSQPVGFPATKTGEEIRILEHLFTPEEAVVASGMSYTYRSIQQIYEKLQGSGITLEELRETLLSMMKKGVIGYREADGVEYFNNVPLVVGMYEGQVNRLTTSFLSNFRKYTTNPRFGLEFISSGVSQMRTIPVERSITPKHHVATYDEIGALLENARGPFLTLACICRQAAGRAGKRCSRTSRVDTCLALDDTAAQCLKMGLGREITRQEAIRITRENEREGLVLQPANEQAPEFICACCSCCCGMISMLKRLHRPLDYWSTNYYSQIEGDACTGCGACVKICPVDAVRARDRGIPSTDLHRCIGCGLCVPRCPVGARSLVKRKKQTVPPPSSEDLYGKIMEKKKGTFGKFLLAARIMLRL